MKMDIDQSLEKEAKKKKKKERKTFMDTMNAIIFF